MALQRYLRYPGRFANPTTEQPQGAAKNRSAPGIEDGSYLEADWLNDMFGFLSYMLSKSGIAANGTPDNATASQYAQALALLTLSRTDPFADIKADGTVTTALANLGLSGVVSGSFPIGMPFYWPNATMPNVLNPAWSGMTFLKWNGATFSAATYPELAMVVPGLRLTEARGEFIRVWDDGRNVDAGRALLSAQGDAIRNIVASGLWGERGTPPTGQITGAAYFDTARGATWWGSGQSDNDNYVMALDASRVVPTATENRPRNIAFNLLVRAK